MSAKGWPFEELDEHLCRATDVLPRQRKPKTVEERIAEQRERDAMFFASAGVDVTGIVKG